MQWNTSKNAGFSDADHVYEAVLDDEVFGYQYLNVEQQRATPDSLWHTMRHMLQTRKHYKAFGRGAFDFELPDNDGVLCYWRVLSVSTGDETDAPTEERERFLIVCNLTDEPQSFALDLVAYAGTQPVDVLLGTDWPEIQTEPYSVDLAPYACHWLKFWGEPDRPTIE
jgi:maltose alpha-D-glucosyltransferase/alpha-amylase